MIRDRERLKELWLAGEPGASIAEILGCASHEVYIARKKLGLPARPRIADTKWALEGGQYRPWLHQRSELEDLVLSGAENEEIAALLGRTVDGVRHERRRLALPSGALAMQLLAKACGERGVDAATMSSCFSGAYGARKYIVRAQSEAARVRAEVMRRERSESIAKYDAASVPSHVIANILDISETALSRWRARWGPKRPHRKRQIARGGTLRDARSRILPDGLGGIA